MRQKISLKEKIARMKSKNANSFRRVSETKKSFFTIKSERLDLTEEQSLDFFIDILQDEEGELWDEQIGNKILRKVRRDPETVNQLLLLVDRSPFDPFDDAEKAEIYYLLLDDLDMLSDPGLKIKMLKAH